MRLLFDQNLAPSLLRRLADQHPDSAHTFGIGFGEADDRQIWEYARDRGFAIVSKDSDFHHLSVREGPPPKVIWLRLGNCSVRDVEALLRAHLRELEEFASGPAALLVLGSMP